MWGYLAPNSKPPNFQFTAFPLDSSSPRTITIFFIQGHYALAFDLLKSPRYKVICVGTGNDDNHNLVIDLYFSESDSWKLSVAPINASLLNLCFVMERYIGTLILLNLFSLVLIEKFHPKEIPIPYKFNPFTPSAGTTSILLPVSPDLNIGTSISRSEIFVFLLFGFDFVFFAKMNSVLQQILPMIGFVLFAAFQLGYGQTIASSPAPAPASDGTTIDQGIAYLLLLVALAITYLVH